jgi:hypothetical protein
MTTLVPAFRLPAAPERKGGGGDAPERPGTATNPGRGRDNDRVFRSILD